MLITKSHALRRKELDASRRDQLLQRPTASKPSTASETQVAVLLSERVIPFIATDRAIRSSDPNIGQIDVTLLRIAIPLKHGVNGLGKLSAARLVDAASVHPKVPNAVLSSLVAAEDELAVTRLLLPRALEQVFQGHLCGIFSPRMGEYGVWWDITSGTFDQAEGFLVWFKV
jgi:hypothetical protein